MKILNHLYKNLNIFASYFIIIYIWSEMLSSSLHAKLKPSKTTSTQKLFPSDMHHTVCDFIIMERPKLLYRSKEINTNTHTLYLKFYIFEIIHKQFSCISGILQHFFCVKYQIFLSQWGRKYLFLMDSLKDYFQRFKKLI